MTRETGQIISVSTPNGNHKIVTLSGIYETGAIHSRSAHGVEQYPIIFFFIICIEQKF